MRSKSREIPERWRKLFRLIPGYDPIATAGDCWFDADTADRVVAFFPTFLSHVEGKLAGKPFVLVPWQAAHIGCAFGWKRPDGTRRYREVFDYEPRKNGKTTKVGGLVNLVAYCDNEPGAQLYSTAADREQAALVYRQAKGMITQNQQLAAQARIYATFKSIEYANGAIYKALSAEADTKHGFNSHLVVIDELHAQPDRDLVDVLITSTGSRRQPLIWYITTADYIHPSICNEKYEYACKVRDGIISDPAFLPIIYEATADDPWDSPDTWRKANPNLGVSVSLEYLERECLRAKEVPAYENTFRRLHLNQRTEQDVRWIPMELWQKGAAKFDPRILEGRRCFAGLDFGWRDDYAALVLDFPFEGQHYWLSWFWLPREGRRDKRQQPTAEFVASGLVTVTDGNATDIKAIYKTLHECRDRYDVLEVCLDPNNARKQGQDLMEDGFEVFEFIQSKRSYNEPCRLAEMLLKEGRLRHGGNRVLNWMASNVTVELDGLGQMMPKKVKSSEKIDGICAGLMGLARAMLREDDSGSVYASRGILTI